MTGPFAMFFIGQSILVIGAIIATYVKTSVAIAKLQVTTEHIRTCHDGRAKEIRDVKIQLSDVSRRLEHIETLQTAFCHDCPLSKPVPKSLGD